MAFPVGWNRKASLTIPVRDSPLTDFTIVLFHTVLPSEMFDADGSYHALNGGGDIRFSSDAAGTVQLPCDIITFVTDNNPANGRAEIAVKLSLSDSIANVFYVWYNKSGETQPIVSDTYGQYNAYDINFTGVFPLHESGFPYSNRKANFFHFTAGVAPTRITDSLRDAQEFDGIDDTIHHEIDALTTGNHDTISIIVDPITVVNPEDAVNNGPIMSQYGANFPLAFYLGFVGTDETDETISLLDGGTPMGGTYTREPLSFGYTQLAMSWDGTKYNMIVNNSLQTIYPYAGTQHCRRIADMPWEVGSRTSIPVYRNIKVADIRISSVGRSQYWLYNEILNLLYPADIITVGTPEFAVTTSPIHTQNINKRFGLA